MTNDIYVSPRACLPEVDFRFSRHQRALRGNSCPPSATAFYGPLSSALMSYLASTRGHRIKVDVAPALFDASSRRVLRGLFGMLESACISDNTVHVDWHYDPAGIAMRDLGLDLAEEFIMLDCRLLPQSGIGVRIG